MPELSMPLSKHFTLRELLRSNTAERDARLKREQENPPPEIIDNLRYLVSTALQPLRNKIGYPIHINSGYRSPLVNQRVGGSATSQHCRGEAADCEISPAFLTDPQTRAIRNEIKSKVRKITGNPLKPGVDQNFFLFAYICLHLEELDVDQVIHEYGEDFGQPAWIHVSASQQRDRRQVLFVGRYTKKKYLKPSPQEALAYGTSKG